ncbi:MAG TPA: lipopolysaccharide heptosyltransferase I [Thermoanaerobaculia bacterium]
MNSILILRLSALGDIVHTIPAVVALRESFSKVRIGWVVERPYEVLVRTVAPVDEVFPVATKRWRREASSRSTRTDLAALRRTIRGFARGETSIDFQGLVKSASLGWMSGARQRFGFDRHAIREKPALLFTNRRVAVDPGGHVVEQNLTLARGVGAEQGGVPAVDYSRFLDGRDSTIRAVADARPIVFLPGAGREEKQWPVDAYAALAPLLPAPVVAMWGPGEEELAREVERRSNGVAAAGPPSNLQQLAYVLGHARVVIGGDTGPLHLAAALGVQVVGLFGPTNPARNGPFGQLDRCVSTWSTTRAIADISPSAVLAAAGR